MNSRIIGAVVLSIALIVGGLTFAPSAGATPPSGDPFYRYSGNLATKSPGQILKSRAVKFVSEGQVIPVAATQLLYRSVGEHNQPITGVTTVLRPRTAKKTRILSFHMAYDGLGSQCDPSYTLQGNKPGAAGRLEQVKMLDYLARGFTVVVPDYEGQQQEWTIARQSARLALDSVRAAQKLLRLPSSTPVGLLGYSGGSVPTEFGAELAPTYAPELNIIGAAAGGLPVNLADNLGYVSGSKTWAGVIPALVEVYRRTYRLDVASFLSKRGLYLIAKVRNGCIASFASKYPGLTNADMVRSPYTSLLQVPAVSAAIARNVMGTLGRPRVPMLLGVGQSDPIGDGVMITADVAKLAANYCATGVRARFARYAGDSHAKAFFPFESQADNFLTSLFERRPVATC
ncbi:putative lipase [Gordonia effusa NBRC 100432]|uniref:Putative lipase n=1 Tax=Gordonia effusa NBRC 100432 TaxID=1077974 RepID=H0R300_9ACTN|nr:lipase family protein [Gordonia effusa]GAB19451.1 putative lipase [Gordonia effusa NBRC 100432]